MIMIKEILREKKTMNHSRILHRNAKSLTLNFRLEKSYDDQLWSIVSKMFLNLLKLFHLNRNVNIYLRSNIFQLHISLKNKINLSEAGFVLLQFRWIALSFFKNTLHLSVFIVFIIEWYNSSFSGRKCILLVNLWLMKWYSYSFSYFVSSSTYHFLLHFFSRFKCYVEMQYWIGCFCLTANPYIKQVKWKKNKYNIKIKVISFY